MEGLEGRALFSLFDPGGSTLIAPLRPQQQFIDSAIEFPAVASPAVTGSRPAANAIDVLRDAHVSADVHLPNPGRGVDGDTLTSAAVRLYKTNTGTPVSANLDTTGGGDAIILQPNGLLAPLTSYTFEITSGVRDTAGAPFTPYKIRFKTGTATSATPTTVEFRKTSQPITNGQRWTGLTFGPDGNLYASTQTGRIYRFNPDGSGKLGTGTLINTVRSKNGGDRLISGVAFDPASTAGNLVLWVSHSHSTLENASDWTGKISVLTGEGLGSYRDVVTGLPRSIRDHVTNQPTFGPDGALYLNQGSMSAMGAPDNAWGNRSEHLLSGAILRVDTKAITGTLNVKTEAGGTYNPFAAGAPVTIYAEGVRNAYDGVWHRNGHYFVPANGSAAGGSTPAGGRGEPAITNVQETQPDFLFDIKKGGYYGHPNPLLGNYILNGGDPTAGVDPNEVASYRNGTQPDANYRGSVYTFGQNYSANGIIEYKGSAFGGTLDGKLLVARYSGGDDIVILTPDPNGNIVAAERRAPGLTGFNDPLDLVQDPATGFIYVAEHGGQTITLLTPSPAPEPPAPSLAVTSLKLLNAADGSAISSLNNGATIDLAQARRLSVSAVLAGAAGSVKFTLDGATFRVENAPPYVINGDDFGKPIAWTPALGTHTLRVTPYSGAGGSGTIGTSRTVTFTVIDSSAAPTSLFRANINFQPDGAAVPAGYKADIGRTYGVRSNGLTYGWSAANEVNAVDRNDPDSYDQRFDTFNALGALDWAIKVPNGTYSVYLAAGDPGSIDAVYGIDVEGQLAASGIPTLTRPWVGGTVTAQVTDGTLTLRRAAGSRNNKLAFIQIAQLS